MLKGHKANCPCCICRALRGESIPWNKGLSKETHPSVAASAEKNRGKVRNEETRKKMSIAHIGKTKENDSGRAVQAEKMRGRTKENYSGRAVQAEKMRGRTKENDLGYAIISRKLGGRTKETYPYLEAAAEKLRGRTPWNKGLTKEIDERVAKSAERNRGSNRSKETCKKMSIVGKKRWQDPEWREKQLKAIFAGMYIKPTKPEKLLDKLLQELFPNEWRYIGDGSLLIGYKNPDFVNVNGQKKIIEMNGDYWHSEELTGRTKIEEEQQRIDHFAQYGYQTLIIWEHELDDRTELEERLLQFQLNP